MTRPEWRAAFQKLAKRVGLEELSFGLASHHDESTVGVFFEKGAKCRLTSLFLGEAAVTDALLSSILKSPSAETLESLRLDGARVTLPAVLRLLTLPRLHTLALSGMYRPGGSTQSWSDEERAALLSAMEALPTTHPLRNVGLPESNAASVHETHPRFKLLR